MAKKKPIVSKEGQWKYPGQETIIPNVNGRITMRGVPYPVLGIDDLGNQQMMMPGAEYKFPGNSVYEIPMANRNIMDRGFDRGSGNSTGVNWPTELTNEQRALDDWQKLTSNGRPTFEKRIPAPDDKTYQQLLSRYKNGGTRKVKIHGLPRAQGGTEVPPIGVPPEYETIKVTDPNDPRYLEYLYLQNLYNWSNLQDFDQRYLFKDPGYYYGNVGEDYKYAPNEYSEDYTEHTTQHRDGSPGTFTGTFDPKSGKTNYISDESGYYGSKVNEFNFTTKAELDAWIRKNRSLDPGIYSNYPVYNDERQYWNEILTKYQPIGYDAMIDWNEPDYGANLAADYDPNKKRWIYKKPATQFIEDKIDRAGLRKIYPYLTDKELDEYVRNKRLDPDYITNSLNPVTKRNLWIRDNTNNNNEDITKKHPLVFKQPQYNTYDNDGNIIAKRDINGDIDYPHAGTPGYLQETIVDWNQTQRARYLPRFGPPESYLGKRYEYEDAKQIEKEQLQDDPNKIVYTLDHTDNGGGVAYIRKSYRDADGNYHSDLLGSTLTEDWMTPEQQKQFDSPTGGSMAVQFNPNVKIWNNVQDPLRIIDERRGYKQKAANMQQKATNEVDAEKAAYEQYQQQLRDKEKARLKKTAEQIESEKKAGGYAYGGTAGPGKPKVEFASKTKSSDENYLYKQTYYQDGTSENKNRRTLKGFITGAPKPGEPGGPPKLQNGGFATAADSSLIANRANDIVNFYKNAGYTKERRHSFTPGDPEFVFSMIAEDRLAPGTFQSGAKYKNGQLMKLGNGQMEPVWDTDIYQKLDNYKFQQRESAQGVLNMDSPMQLYDTRISPQYLETFNEDRVGGTGDAVGVYTYDKLAVTPWKKLTTKQRIQRLEKFGTSGSPYKDKASAIKELKAKLNPPKKEETPKQETPVIDKPVEVKGQPEDIKEDSKTFQDSSENYTLHYSGNPGVAYLYYKKNNPDGTYTQKLLGATETSKWLNDEQQKQFHSPSGGSARVKYNPDIKTYTDVKDAIDQVEKFREEQKESVKQKPKVKNIVVPPGLKYGGSLPKAQRGTYIHKQPRIIEVDSEDDPLIQAERDSATVAAATNNMIQHLHATPNANAWMQYANNWYNRHGTNSPFAKAFSRLTKLNKKSPTPGMISHLLLPGGGNFPQTAVQYMPPQTHVVVRPQPKMKEAGLLPLPTVDIKPQLQNIPSISNPYSAKPKTEYFLMPSGNPGVGVIHSRTYDGAGSYSEKIIGPSLAKDWLNDEGQRNFDTKDMSSRIDYDPRDTDQKVYSDMYDATQEIEKLRQQEKEARKPKKTPKVRIIKTPKFANGGDIAVPDLRRVKIDSLPKAQEGGDFNFDYNFDKSFAENMELNRRAQAMGWNSVKEYEASGWGRKGYVRVPDVIRQQRIAKGIPADQIPEYEKIETRVSQNNSPELQAILKKGQEATAKTEWEQLGYENRFYNYKNDADFFDSHARLNNNSRSNDWIKDRVLSGDWEYNPVTQETRRVKPENKANVSADTKFYSKDFRTWTKEDKLAHPSLAYMYQDISPEAKTEFEQLRKDNKSFNDYAHEQDKEEGKRTVLKLNEQMYRNPIYYAPGLAFMALEVAPALLGAELFGSGITVGNVANTAFIANGLDNTIDPNSDMRKSWSKAYNNPNQGNLSNAALETGLNALNFLGVKSLPADLKAFNNFTNKTATKLADFIMPQSANYWQGADDLFNMGKTGNSGLLNSPQLRLPGSFSADLNSGNVTRTNVGGSRNLGVYDYNGNVVKVVKNKRAVSPDQVALMQSKLGDMDNVFFPKATIDLGNNTTGLVMNKANGVDASKLTTKDVNNIPEEHWNKFEQDVRELSNRGVQVDLTKRDNLFYDKNKGFSFIDINGISMDGTSTNKFIDIDGVEHYHPFEQYPFFPKEFKGGKSMFESMPTTKGGSKGFQNSLATPSNEISGEGFEKLKEKHSIKTITDKAELDRIIKDNPGIEQVSLTGDKWPVYLNNPSDPAQQTRDFLEQSLRAGEDFALNWAITDPAAYKQIRKPLTDYNNKLKLLDTAKENAKTEISKAVDDIHDKEDNLFIDYLVKEKGLSQQEAQDISYGNIPDIKVRAAYWQELRPKWQADLKDDFAKIGKLQDKVQAAEQTVSDHRKTLFTAVPDMRKMIAESDALIDPRYKSRIENLFKESGISMPSHSNLLNSVDPGASELIFYGQNEPSFTGLSQRNKDYLNQNFQKVEGFKSSDATVTLGGRNSNTADDPIVYFQRPGYNREEYTEMQKYGPAKLFQPNTWLNPYKKPFPVVRAKYTPIEGAYDKPVLIHDNRMRMSDPTKIEETSTHESGHDISNVYNWIDSLVKYDPKYNYNINDVTNPFAKRFADAMVEPVPITKLGDTHTSETWHASIGELHSELMIARLRQAKKLMLEENINMPEAIQKIKDAEDMGSFALFNNYLSNHALTDGGLDKHFKPGTTFSEKTALLMRLPKGDYVPKDIGDYQEVLRQSRKHADAYNSNSELARANQDALTFTNSPANKAKLQTFRPGQNFSVTNQTARFIDDPEAIRLFGDYEPGASIEKFLGSSQGQYGARDYGDMQDVVLVDKFAPKTSNVPSNSIYTDALHENTHSRSIRLQATDAEKQIATDAWKPMITEKAKTEAFGMPEEEAFAVQNELRIDKLKDIDGTRVYTEKDIPEIKKGLEEMINVDRHTYLKGVKVEDFDMKALINSLNKIGLGVGVGVIIGAGATQEKKKGGQIRKLQRGGSAKRFNTKLRGTELNAFNQHAQQFPSLLTDKGDYDTQGFYRDVYNNNNGDINAITAALTPGSPTAHVGTDRYKKPNHPTFSKESKYHVPILRPAGEWGHNEEGNYDYFNASRRNIKNMTKSDGSPLDYFKRAEDYNQDGTPDVKLFYKGQPMFKEGGSVKKVKINTLPKNWKTK